MPNVPSRQEGSIHDTQPPAGVAAQPPTFFLRTKLLPPRPAPSLLPRPRLNERLEQNLAHAVTLVTAPAGSGKTTLVADFVRRAEACGCEAIVVTLDTMLLGWRARDLDLGFLPFLLAKGIAQYMSDEVFRSLRAHEVPGASSGPVTPRAILSLVRLARRYPKCSTASSSSSYSSSTTTTTWARRRPSTASLTGCSRTSQT